jgi:hypothetical protein
VVALQPFRLDAGVVWVVTGIPDTVDTDSLASALRGLISRTSLPRRMRRPSNGDDDSGGAWGRQKTPTQSRR